MSYARCPTSIVNAPLDIVWTLLTRPEQWGDFYDLRICSVEPAGPAVAGQSVKAESGPRFLHLKLEFRFSHIDNARHQLDIDVRLPFGIRVREQLNCLPLGPDRCRVNYNCNFGFPPGWRGAVVRFLMRGELDSGPANSLARLKQAAEQCHAARAAAQRARP